MYLSLCDCWGSIEMSTVIEIDGRFYVDESREQLGNTLTDYTTFFDKVLSGEYSKDEHLEYIGEL